MAASEARPWPCPGGSACLVPGGPGEAALSVWSRPPLQPSLEMHVPTRPRSPLAPVRASRPMCAAAWPSCCRNRVDGSPPGPYRSSTTVVRAVSQRGWCWCSAAGGERGRARGLGWVPQGGLVSEGAAFRGHGESRGKRRVATGEGGSKAVRTLRRAWGALATGQPHPGIGALGLTRRLSG